MVKSAQWQPPKDAIHEFDFLFGEGSPKGKNLRNRAGHIFVSSLIASLAKVYQESDKQHSDFIKGGTARTKNDVAREIIDKLRERGGAFKKKSNSGQWTEPPEQDVRIKISNLFSTHKKRQQRHNKSRSNKRLTTKAKVVHVTPDKIQDSECDVHKSSVSPSPRAIDDQFGVCLKRCFDEIQTESAKAEDDPSLNNQQIYDGPIVAQIKKSKDSAFDNAENVAAELEVNVSSAANKAPSANTEPVTLPQIKQDEVVAFKVAKEVFEISTDVSSLSSFGSELGDPIMDDAFYESNCIVIDGQWDHPGSFNAMSDTYAAMKTREHLFLPLPVQSLNSPIFHRAFLIDWMFSVGRKCLLSESTIHGSVLLLDKLLRRATPPKKRFKTLAASCLSISAKSEASWSDETLVQALLQCSGLRVEGLSPETFAQEEFTVLRILNWKINPVSPCHLLHYFFENPVVFIDDSRCNPLLQTMDVLAETTRAHAGYLCDLTLRDYRFQAYEPTKVAAAVVLASRVAVGVSPGWRQELVDATGYAETEIDSIFQSIWAAANECSPRYAARRCPPSSGDSELREGAINNSMAHLNSFIDEAGTSESIPQGKDIEEDSSSCATKVSRLFHALDLASFNCSMVESVTRSSFASADLSSIEVSFSTDVLDSISMDSASLDLSVSYISALDLAVCHSC